MSRVITKKQQKKDKGQVNLEREYRVSIKSGRDKIGITRHIMMHQVLYIVPMRRVTCTLYSTWVHHDMPCDTNLVSSAFYTIHIFPF